MLSLGWLAGRTDFSRRVEFEDVGAFAGPVCRKDLLGAGILFISLLSLLPILELVGVVARCLVWLGRFRAV
jgi:hypothetical protein